MSNLLKVKVGGSDYLCKIRYNDPRILLLWYGTQQDYQKPTGGITNPIIEYDENGPLNLTGTDWSGTPCIAKNNLGGRLNGGWLVEGKGLQWTQPSIISQLVKNKPFTVEFWLKNDYPTTTHNFGDGGYPLSFITKQDFQMAGTDLIPNPSFGGFYGASSYQCIYNTSNFTYYTLIGGAWSDGSKWTHIAVCNDGTGNKSGLHYFCNGIEYIYTQKCFGETMDDTRFEQVFKNTQALLVGYVGATNSCNWRFAQLVVFNYCKYTNNFTPQRKPYYLGVD